ncbi:MAG: SDR family oxidoreductase [Stackebrandtia sp.]
MTGQILITGADGYLGRRIAARLLVETGDRLLLTVRADDRAELTAKGNALQRELRRFGSDGRIRVAAADLRRREPFAAIDPRRVTAVVHTAARTAFNVERSTAQAVNVDGTARVAGFARDCPKLERLLVLSTVFSSGRRTGVIPEAPHDADGGFVNHYEWSKNAAEHQLLTDSADLPLTIARLTTIVADDDTGAVTQYNVFHRTLKLFFYGLLSLMPGDPATSQSLATAEFSSRGAAHLLRPEIPAGIYHLAPAPAETLPLEEVLDIAFDVFDADPGFRRRRLLRPSYCDLESFRDLAEASKSLSVSPMAQAIGSVAPFAEQMFLNKEFDNSRLREVWPDCPSTDPRRLVAATCAHLVGTRWGRHTTSPAAAGN